MRVEIQGIFCTFWDCISLFSHLFDIMMNEEVEAVRMNGGIGYLQDCSAIDFTGVAHTTLPHHSGNMHTMGICYKEKRKPVVK